MLLQDTKIILLRLNYERKVQMKFGQPNRQMDVKS